MVCVCGWACDSILMVKNILGVAPPPNHRKKLWKNGKCNHLALLLGRSKFSLTALTTISETYQLLWVCHFTSIGGLVHKKSMILKIFGVYLSEFLIFLYEIFFGSTILLSFCDKHQNFDYGCSRYPGNEAQSPDFGHFLTILGIF